MSKWISKSGGVVRVQKQRRAWPSLSRHHWAKCYLEAPERTHCSRQWQLPVVVKWREESLEVVEGSAWRQIVHGAWGSGYLSIYKPAYKAFIIFTTNSILETTIGYELCGVRAWWYGWELEGNWQEALQRADTPARETSKGRSETVASKRIPG